MIEFKTIGDFENTKKFLNAAKSMTSVVKSSGLINIANQGVKELNAATPVKTGVTAASWDYEIEEQDGKISIYWTNSNIVKGINIAVILQTGHGTKNGGYVQGRDYINPALQPIFDSMTESMWKAVVSL